MRTPDDAVVAALTRLYTLVIIIGLPGSGKTDFAVGCVAPLGYAFHDDFVRDFHNGAVRADIGAGQRVCVADARLCEPPRFWAFMRAFSRLVPPDETLVVFFENDVEMCLKNSAQRLFICNHTTEYVVTDFATVHSSHIVIPVRPRPLFAP